MAYSHLTVVVPITIKLDAEKGERLRAIGRLLGRSHTTISREIKCNSGMYTDGFDPVRAHKHAELRKYCALKPLNVARRGHPSICCNESSSNIKVGVSFTQKPTTEKFSC